MNTLGSTRPGTTIDNSFHHEIDLVLISPTVLNGKCPEHDQLFLGVKCKAHANLSKSAVRQVLGNHRSSGDVTGGYIIIIVDRLRGPVELISERILEMKEPKG